MGSIEERVDRKPELVARIEIVNPKFPPGLGIQIRPKSWFSVIRYTGLIEVMLWAPRSCISEPEDYFRVFSRARP